MDPRDAYGNPVRRTDEYGNPVQQHSGGTMGSYGADVTGSEAAAMRAPGAGFGAGYQPQEHRPGGGLSGMLHRSGSSSSSSSEDDGQGGRRKKKGLKQKIKEKLPGGGGGTGTTAPSSTQGGYYGGDQVHHGHGHGHGHGHDTEKKGFMEKIKDKLPGSHSNH